MEIRNYIVDHLKPVTYFTFDDDQIDLNGQSTQTSNPFILIDESGYNNHASVYTDYKNNQSAYKLGQQALTTKQNTLNRSMRFNGISKVYEDAPKTVMSIPTTPENWLSSNFTISFNFMYGDEITSLHQDEARLRKPLIVNLNRFEVYETYQPSNLVIDINGKTVFSDGIGNIRKRGLQHFIIRKRGSTVEVFINANLVAVTKDVPENTEVNNWHIGGTPELVSNYHKTHGLYDWYIDNFFILNYWIDNQQIVGLSKRMFYYEDMIEYMNPYYHIQCYDTDINHTNTIDVKIGRTKIHVENNIIKDQGYNRKVGYESNSIYISGRNRLYTGVYPPDGIYPSQFFRGSEYTIGIWVKLENSTPSTIVDAANVYRDANSDLRCHIQANLFHGENKVGMISAYDEYDNILYSDRNVNLLDGQWHHVLFESTRDEARLYIDGVMTDFRKRYKHRDREFMNMSIFSTVFKSHYSQGFMHDFVFFPRILNDMQKQLLYGYGLQYLIRGRTTYKGIPRSVDVRVLDYDTYELLYTGKSDYKGEFKIPLKSQQRVVVNVFDHNDETVDMNIRGAIIPYVEFEEN